jgi:hypothetical protein
MGEVVPIRDYIDRRFEGSEKLSETRAHAIEQAVTVAMAALDKRLDGMNEIKAMAAQQAATLLPRGEFAVQFKALEQKLDAEHASLEKKIETTAAALTQSDKDARNAQGVMVAKMNQVLIAIIAAMFAATVTVAGTFILAHSLIPTPSK